MRDQMGFIKALSRLIVDLRCEDLPLQVVPWVNAAVTDYFAVALVGCRAEGPKLVRRHVWSQYATGGATIIGDTARMSADAAAFMRMPKSIAGPLILFICLTLGAIAPAFAQAYPTKPIRMIVTFPPGSGADISARTVGQKMGETLGQQVVIDNRAGAGGIIGAELVARAEPDGYTILVLSSAHTMHPSTYGKLPYDLIKEFLPITMLVSTPYLLVAHPSVPAKNVAELIALAKSKPGQINYASGGFGVGSHLAGELFKIMAGIDIRNVPYKGSPQATTDVVGGQVQLSFSTLPTALPLIRGGKLRALGVTSAKRVAAIPEIPAISETVPKFDVVTWWGLVVPARTPKAVIVKLHDHVVKALQTPDIMERLSAQGFQTVGNTPPQFEQFIKGETETWQSVAKTAGIKPIQADR